MTLRPHTPICSRAAPRASTVWLLVALALGACSLLTSPEQGEIKCEVTKGGKDPCPGATTCVDKVCKTVPVMRDEDCDDGVDNDGDHQVDEHDDSIEEDCDGLDNDCDGEIDEGFKDRPEFCDTVDNDCDGETDEGYDQDDDGFTSCGDLKLKPDCEPTQATAHPGAKEICDGLDNDCDGTTDNAPSASESLCDKETELCLDGRCVRNTCAIPNSDKACKVNERCVDDKCVPMDCATPCGSSQFCDMTTTPPTCKEVPRQRKIGEACTLDTECQSSLCIDSVALNLSPESAPRRVCGKACCSDTECATGETCFAASTGARSCLPRTMMANTYPAAAKPCSAINQCTAPQVCAVGEVTQAPSGSKAATSFCRSPGPLGLNERPVAEACSNPSQCSSRLCQAIVFSSVCTAPCNVSGDCAKLSEYLTILPVHAYCQYVDYGQYSPIAGVSYGPMCFTTADAQPAGPPLKECRVNTDCPDQTCIGASAIPSRPGKCAPTCCSDLQCTTLRPNARCLPLARGTRRYEMRCTEQPPQQ
jgi:hypothetical protein